MAGHSPVPASAISWGGYRGPREIARLARWPDTRRSRQAQFRGVVTGVPATLRVLPDGRTPAGPGKRNFVGWLACAPARSALLELLRRRPVACEGLVEVGAVRP